MSTAPLRSVATPYSPFSSRSQTNRMAQSQTPGLDTLAEGSQYAFEQLQLARQTGAVSTPSAEPETLQSFGEENGPHPGGRGSSQSRDTLTEARSTIRKLSSATSVRRRISRACDQCNQLRTKCDGQQPCAHCLGSLFPTIASPIVIALTDSRVRTQLRVRSRTQETRQGLKERYCSSRH